jgi:release factor glutamine methyltransferase
MTVSFLTGLCAGTLSGIYEPEEAKNIAGLLVEKHIPQTVVSSYEKKHFELSDTVVINIKEQLQKLLQNEPVQYVLQEAWFYKYPFYVDKNVLIPRPETEELVSLLVQMLRFRKINYPKILEIGTGSGCMAISIKKEFPDAFMMAIDISSKAIAIAKKNAQLLNTDVQFDCMDFLQEENRELLPLNFDFIISNPPYILLEEKNRMEKNVVDFEPHEALFVPENNPLIFYKNIAAFAKQQVCKPVVFCEINATLYESTAKIFTDKAFQKVQVLPDMQNRKRMLIAE